MGRFVTQNFSGRFVIQGKRQIGKDVADQPVYCGEIFIVPQRMGTDSAGKVIGFFDTETMLPEAVKEACIVKWGEDYLPKLDQAIDKGPHNLRLLLPGEKIAVEGIKLDPVNPADMKRVPKSRRATVIQGAITAASFSGERTPRTAPVDEGEVVVMPESKQEHRSAAVAPRERARS